MSDSFDGDPDDVFEPDEPETEYGEQQFDQTNPAARYEEGTFDTSQSVPEAPEPDDLTDVDYSDVDPELRQLFWKLVLVVKFALISLTLGALFLTLGNDQSLGVQFLAFGAVLISYGAYQYRKSKARIDSEEFDSVQSEEDATEYPTGDDS
ncbi:DUF7322 domain-containing protein [Halovenus sp. HT40]|uniref:DUF7322 domain-containing protein n=1 Tax=Halovenus sp. HT40 TaxID=3126691 RepID=UPI00300E7F15